MTLVKWFGDYILSVFLLSLPSQTNINTSPFSHAQNTMQFRIFKSTDEYHFIMIERNDIVPLR